MNAIFFFNDTATTEIYTLSLHDALPIYATAFRDSWLFEELYRARNFKQWMSKGLYPGTLMVGVEQYLLHADHERARVQTDRKSTRLNSSHVRISYAVFCL